MGNKDARRKPRALFPLLLAGVAATLLAAALWNAVRAREATAVAPTGVEGTRTGDTAPDFRLVDVTGRVDTRPTLLAGGKPGLLFFTATWCLPCVEGLRELHRFQQEVGSERFRVLIVFVDPRETDEDLRTYRDRYGFPGSWFFAADRDRMVLRYRVRFLDTKFLLDPQGVIRWTDVYPATYQTWRRALAVVGVGR
ncbi:MAG: TlpA family protein disulfide reductase [bacterium]